MKCGEKVFNQCVVQVQNVIVCLAAVLLLSAPSWGRVWGMAGATSMSTKTPSRVSSGEPIDEYLINNQQPVILGTIGAGYEGEIWDFELDQAAESLETIAGAAPGGEEVLWYTSYIVSVPFETGTLPLDKIAALRALDADLYWTVGTLTGPFGSVDAVAVTYSATDNTGSRRHFLMPIAEVSDGLVDLLTTIVTEIEAGAGPGFGDCYQTYRTRLARVLRDFNICMADQVPPIGLPAIACFVLCAPFLWGGPVGYAICVAACLAGVALGGLIGTSTCMESASAARLNALSSYCLCIQQSGEPDIVGCAFPK